MTKSATNLYWSSLHLPIFSSNQQIVFQPSALSRFFFHWKVSLVSIPCPVSWYFYPISIFLPWYSNSFVLWSFINFTLLFDLRHFQTITCEALLLKLFEILRVEKPVLVTMQNICKLSQNLFSSRLLNFISLFFFKFLHCEWQL